MEVPDRHFFCFLYSSIDFILYFCNVGSGNGLPIVEINKNKMPDVLSITDIGI